MKNLTKTTVHVKGIKIIKIAIDYLTETVTIILRAELDLLLR